MLGNCTQLVKLKELRFPDPSEPCDSARRMLLITVATDIASHHQ